MKTVTWKPFLCAVLVLPAVVCGKSLAASFDEALTAASASVPLGADVASMGSIGNLDGYSSANPAITAIMKDSNVGGSLTYGYMKFQRTELTTAYGSVVGKLGNAVMQVAFSHAQSPMRAIDESQSFRIRKNDTVYLQFGSKVASGVILDGDELYLGAGYSYTQSAYKAAFTSPMVMAVDTDNEAHTARLGFAYKPIARVTLGGLGSRSWCRARYSYDGVQDPQAYESFNDAIRVGFSAKILEGTTLAADYQRISFSTSFQQFHQYYAGVEQYLVKDVLAIYGGAANDAPTAGIGLYFKNGGVNLSYGHNMLKEVRSYFGRSDSYMVSAYFNF